MMNDLTLQTYNDSAQAMAEYFSGIGSRIDDIEMALRLADKTDGSADVLELGCGDGRDAAEIVKRSESYLGIDYSEGLLALARKQVPGADFRLQSILDYTFEPASYDVVFAFASLLHVNRDTFAALMPRIANSLRADGIFYVSLKYADDYKEELKEDQFGKRMFYFYNLELVEELAGQFFEVVHTNQETIGHTRWFDIALKKK